MIAKNFLPTSLALQMPDESKKYSWHDAPRTSSQDGNPVGDGNDSSISVLVFSLTEKEEGNLIADNFDQLPLHPRS